MKTFKIITLGIATLISCGSAGAEMLNDGVSGSGCVINQSALASYNQNAKQTINIQLDSLKEGVNQKIISFAYNLNIPDECSVSPLLLIENFELVNQLDSIDLKDVRFISGAKQKTLEASAPSTLQILIEYQARNNNLYPVSEMTLNLNSVLSL